MLKQGVGVGDVVVGRSGYGSGSAKVEHILLDSGGKKNYISLS